MSFTSDTFAAALNQLRDYAAPAEARLGVTLVPKPRPTPRPAHNREAAEMQPGPLLRAAHAIRSGQTTCAALVERSMAAIDEADASTHAIVTLLSGSARDAARELDGELKAGRWRGPLHGIPVTIKDNINVAGAPTFAGSMAYEGAPKTDAVAVASLRAAGAIVIAKVATHEMALGVTTPQARHPRDSSRIPGGSSGGSAISIVTGMALGSLATDTRASIRVPASLCGVVGFKPTFGSIPADGIVWLSWTMDHIGVLAGSVSDAACLVSQLSSVHQGLMEQAQHGIAGMRIGVPAAAFLGADPEVATAVRLAIKRLEARGVELVAIDCPDDEDFQMSNVAGLVVSRAEALQYHRSLGTDLNLLWDETADQLRIAAEVTAAEYLTAQRFREDLATRMLRLVVDLELDALAMPSTLTTAPLVSEAEQYFTKLSRTAIPWSFIGWPALSVPCPDIAAGSLPVGLQLVAPPFEEATLVSFGCALG